jgi:hypothetical protein
MSLVCIIMDTSYVDMENLWIIFKITLKGINTDA